MNAIAQTDRSVAITAADLPLTCPMPNAPVWNAHPKVALSLKDGVATCPYCGTTYQFSGAAPKGHH